MTSPCHACELRLASVEEPADDPIEPYLVCEGCHARLMARSLRPLEWFNLAKRHGWSQFLLHDDFYDEDGTATQPEKDVDQPELLPAPSLADASRAADSLLDYSITRWEFKDELAEKWRRLSPDEVLAALNRRFDVSRNPAVRSVVLEVASISGRSAEALVRRAWNEYPDSTPYGALVQGSAACLPFEEGFSRADAALAEMPDKTRRECFSALAHFRSPRVLGWIEAHAAEPTVEAWGRLAAASSLSWSAVEKWLAAGRPLNLVAIDALLAIADPKTLFLRKHRPSLDAPPSAPVMQQALEAAAISDPVPRVKQRIGVLMSKVPALTQLS